MQIQDNENKIDFIVNKNSHFIWTSGSDVQKVWRKYGWIPPSEYRQDFLFAKNRGKLDNEN